MPLSTQNVSIVLSLGLALVGAPSGLAAVSFNRDIRPLLSENCFSCHGPDTAKVKAELRLDSRARKGLVYGATDDYCYNITDNPVHVHDLNATILHLLGVDHTRLTYRFQGRNFRLTDVHGELVKAILT